MSKKDILAQGELMPTEVGPWIYVWSPGGRKPTGGRECVISAHGVESRINSGTPKPKVTLYFYCPHGWNLNDPGLVGVNSGRARYYEKLDPGQAKQDYALSKYQGSHAKANETYAYIQNDMHGPNLRRLKEAEFGKIAKFEWIKDETQRNRAIQGKRAEVQRELDAIRDFNMDVVTIRNRRGWNAPNLFGVHITLFRVLNSLNKAGWNYSAVHCSFCRGYSDGSSKGWGTENNPN